MVAVVVHPLVKQVGHGEEADLGMLPAARQVRRREPGHLRHTGAPELEELVIERRPVTLAVLPSARDGVLVPALERRALLALQDGADPPRETALLALDEVAEHL